SLASLANQTYQNLEILLVDDGSPPEYNSLLEEAEAIDPRVRLIKLPSNGGTYRARNIGLSFATGVFTTFQDSDDWSHPRRIESQVAPLLQESDLVASRSVCLRANEDLVLTRIGYPLRHLNTSSLLFR